jgi:hypothetical protein
MPANAHSSGLEATARTPAALSFSSCRHAAVAPGAVHPRATGGVSRTPRRHSAERT